MEENNKRVSELQSQVSYHKEELRKCHQELNTILNNPEYQKHLAIQRIPELFEEWPEDPRKRLTWINKMLKSADDIRHFGKPFAIAHGFHIRDVYFVSAARGILARVEILKEEKKKLQKDKKRKRGE